MEKKKSVITEENYLFVLKIANNCVYHDTDNIRYDEYVTEGIEGAVRAQETYDPSKGVKYSTYCFQCIQNAIRNKIDKCNRHALSFKEDFNFDTYKGATFELADDNMLDIVKSLIRKAVNNNERDAKIVEDYIGVNGDEVSIKELAKEYGMSYERVRVICTKAKDSIRKNKKAKGLLYGFVG